MITYDLCFSWNWEHDADLAALLDSACRARDLQLLQVTPGNLDESLQAIAEGRVGFRTFFDRACDADARFMALVRWALDHSVHCINPYERAARTWDKAVMHWEMVKAGMDVPCTILLKPHDEEPNPGDIDLASLGEAFTIKPAYGSGGAGVMNNATSLDQVLAVRQEHGADRYLLQAQVVPRELDGRPAWFRVMVCTGKVYPCWWDPCSHIYTPVSPEEQSRHCLERLDGMAADIARICGLDLFSTEIAFTCEGRFVAVDYVNDPIDLRLQSRTPGGVPDVIVNDIAGRLADEVAVWR